MLPVPLQLIFKPHNASKLYSFQGVCFWCYRCVFVYGIHYVVRFFVLESNSPRRILDILYPRIKYNWCRYIMLFRYQRSHYVHYVITVLNEPRSRNSHKDMIQTLRNQLLLLLIELYVYTYIKLLNNCLNNAFNA